MWFIGVEVEQETSAPPPKKNPGSAPEEAPNTKDSIGVSQSKILICHYSVSNKALGT